MYRALAGTPAWPLAYGLPSITGEPLPGRSRNLRKFGGPPVPPHKNPLAKRLTSRPPTQLLPLTDFVILETGDLDADKICGYGTARCRRNCKGAEFRIGICPNTYLCCLKGRRPLSEARETPKPKGAGPIATAGP